LLHEPRVLFLDEPTSGLDPEAAKLVREFIEGLKQEGRTIFMCTHNLDEADRLCDRIAVFNVRLLALDTPAALRRQLFGRSVVFHLVQDAEQFATMVAALPFVISVDAIDNKLVARLDEPDEQNPAIVRALVEAGAEIKFVGELRRSLEDVYLELITTDDE
jgi:ABC-2 type transport system ATP-binding protein